MGTGDVLAIIGGSIAAPLVVAAVIGAGRWALARNQLLGKIGELIEKVGDLTEAVTESARDALVLREQFVAHCRQADERWGLVLGGVPSPRPPAYEGPERRAARARVIEADQ